MCKRGQTCKIRAISECSPLLAAGSQKRCVKGPQRWLEAFVPLQSGPAISAAVGEVSVGLIWWPSHPSINEDNGVQGSPAMQGAYVLAQWAFQPTNQHTNSKLSNIPAPNFPTQQPKYQQPTCAVAFLRLPTNAPHNRTSGNRHGFAPQRL